MRIKEGGKDQKRHWINLQKIIHKKKSGDKSVKRAYDNVMCQIPETNELQDEKKRKTIMQSRA